MAQGFESIDQYIGTFPADVQQILQRVRSTIRDVLPEAVEAISYQIPTFKIDGKNVIHFAGWKKHISTYPVPEGDAKFQQRIEQYRGGRGTLKFPLAEPIPYDLITQVAELLVEERFAT